ncbi:MAG: AMP-binding protein [Xanthomonadales bacterium]|nr:AMP-binding protein [Xanthomonadales bacterium]
MKNYQTPQQYLYHREKNHGATPFLHQPRDGRYRVYTWGEAIDHARRLVTALREIGIAPGSKVSIFSANCAEWFIADFALMIGGYISVPIYASANAGTISHIISHSGTRAVFVGRLDDPEAQGDAIPAEITRIAMPVPTASAHHQWDELIKRNQPYTDSPVPDPEDVMTLLYTSGSTGAPKGAIHTFSNFTFAGIEIGKAMGVGSDDRLLSYLPLAHCTERAYVEAASLVFGQQLWFVEGVDKFPQNLRDCAPTFFGSVPRLWKLFQLRVLEKVPPAKLDRLLGLPLIGWLVKRRIKRELGFQNSRWFGSGSAPIAPALLEWWGRLDVDIAEGWGMTETLAYGTMLAFGDPIRTGSIGKAAVATDLRISEAGELEIRTPTMMKGYYLDEAKTLESMTEDGFFKTGDRAEIDSDGYVRITGRVKDLFKTAKGKYVAPVPIESLIARDDGIEQVCLIGSGMKQPVALITLSEVMARTDREVLGAHLERVRKEVNSGLEKHERIDRFVVLDDPWTPENGLLTPTLKVRRHELESRFRGLVEQGYSESVVFAYS